MFKCASMMESVADQTSMLSTIKTINDTRMIKAIDQCNDVKVRVGNFKRDDGSSRHLPSAFSQGWLEKL